VAIILPPQPWTRQPQIAVGINRGHPLAANLFLLANLQEGTTSWQNKAGKTGDLTSASAVTKKAYAGQTTGSVLSAVTNPAVTIPNATLASIIAASGEVTLLVVTQSTALSGHSSSTKPAFSFRNFGTSEHYPFSDNNVYLTTFVATRWVSALSLGSALFDPHVAVVTAKNGAQAFYFNGVQKATGSVAEALSVADSSELSVEGATAMIAMWDRILTPAQVAYVSANPWQLFASLPRRAFAGPSAAGVYTLTADVGNFALSGQDATLSKSSILIAAAGSFALSGQDATLAKTSILVGDVGNFSLSGQDATLAWLPVGAYTLTAETGLFSLSGSDATLTASGAKQTKGGITKHKETKVKKSSTAVRDILRDIIDPQPAEIAQEMREAVLEESAPEVQVNAPSDEQEQEARRIARRRSVLHLLMQD
jgi:hypothetical protein